MDSTAIVPGMLRPCYAGTSGPSCCRPLLGYLVFAKQMERGGGMDG